MKTPDVGFHGDFATWLGRLPTPESKPFVVKGWYVDPDVGRRGVGRALVEAAEAWARSMGCRQMASDAELWNTISHQAHGALGYQETARVVTFKKDLS
jgi:aminoglycoside 6'-N-acetyltransferase I